MFTIKMLDEMIDGLREMSKLIDESRGAIELAKTVSKDVSKVWLAKAVIDICEAQKMPVDDFLDFVKGDFSKQYADIKEEMDKKIAKQGKPDMDVFGFMSWML